MSEPWTSTFDHVGNVVADLESAMARFAEDFGMRWAPVERVTHRVRFDGRELDVELAVTMSLGGPARMELLEEVPGSAWTRDLGHPLHHICYWVPDPAVEARRLCQSGWRVEVTRAGPEEINGFCYLVSPEGFRVEPKAEVTKPTMARWLAGGSLYDATVAPTHPH